MACSLSLVPPCQLCLLAGPEHGRNHPIAERGHAGEHVVSVVISSAGFYGWPLQGLSGNTAAAYWASCRRWPRAKIASRHAARIVRVGTVLMEADGVSCCAAVSAGSQSPIWLAGAVASMEASAGSCCTTGSADLPICRLACRGRRAGGSGRGVLLHGRVRWFSISHLACGACRAGGSGQDVLQHDRMHCFPISRLACQGRRAGGSGRGVLPRERVRWFPISHLARGGCRTDGSGRRVLLHDRIR
jgi:hypothetical protein